MIFNKTLDLDMGEALRYMGVRGQTDPAMLALVERAWALLKEEVQPRWVYRRFDVLPLPGRDIARHLEGCHALYLMALTLGQGPERLIHTLQLTDMALALAVDAAASALVEGYADEAEATLRGQECLTPRFSPGYGDLPLNIQADLLARLDAPRRIGLTVNPGGLLLPQKSITAILGVSERPLEKKSVCETCHMKKTCFARKELGDD